MNVPLPSQPTDAREGCTGARVFFTMSSRVNQPQMARLTLDIRPISVLVLSPHSIWTSEIQRWRNAAL